MSGGHTAVSTAGTVLLEDLELRAFETGVLLQAGANATAARLDVRGADTGVDVASGASLTATNVAVVADVYNAVGVRSAGSLSLTGATLATASGSAVLGYGIRITAGTANASDLVIKGWGFGVSASGTGHSLGPVLFHANSIDLSGSAALTATTPSQIGVDPLFAAWPCPTDVDACDLHPQSPRGRWDSVSRTLTTVDADLSPLVDAGSQVSPRWGDESDTQCRRVNLGAYGGTAQASLGPLAPSPTAGPDPSMCKAFNATSGDWYGGLPTAADAAQEGDVIQLAQATIDGSQTSTLPHDVTVEPLPLATRPILQGGAGN